MTGCCVPGCRSRVEHGISMRRFPRNEAQRTSWVVNIPRKNWKPTDNSYICDVHFSHEMWEKQRVDGKRKLKWNAVPTIFPPLQTLQNSPCQNKESTLVSLKSPPKRVSDVSTACLQQDSCKRLQTDQTNLSTSVTISPLFQTCDNQPRISDSESAMINPELTVDFLEVQTPQVPDASASNSSNPAPESSNSALSEVQTLQKQLIEAKKKLSVAYKLIENSQEQLNKANKRLSVADKIIRKSEKIRRILIAQNKRLRRQKSGMDGSTVTPEKILQRAFNADQMAWLESSSKQRRLYKWSDETIKKALRIRFACTETGYKELINQNIPLPSTRTLRRSLEGINFTPGVCDDIFEALKDKVEQFTDDRDRDCVLGIDEISLAESEKINPSTNSHVAFTTIPSSDGDANKPATHGMVFVLGGVFRRWKQLVAFHRTNSQGFDGAQLKPIINEVIEKAERIGLRMHAVVSDMGSANRGMWRAYGISCHKFSVVKNSVPHPVDPDRRLFFFADGPHLLKNLRSALINNRSIILPPNFVQTYQ